MRMQECNYLWILHHILLSSIETLLFGSDNLTDENNLIVFRNVQQYIHLSNRFGWYEIILCTQDAIIHLHSIPFPPFSPPLLFIKYIMYTFIIYIIHFSDVTLLFEQFIIFKNLQFILLFLNIWTLTFYYFRLKNVIYIFWYRITAWLSKVFFVFKTFILPLG
jgi:hypothetical protein